MEESFIILIKTLISKLNVIELKEISKNQIKKIN